MSKATNVPGGRISAPAVSCGNLDLHLPAPESYPVGMELTSQGSVAACVYFIQDGCVKLTHTSQEDRRMILGFRLPGDLVGASSAIAQQVCAETSTTTVKSSLSRWSATEFLAALRRDDALSFAVHKIMSCDSQQLLHSLANLGLQTARQRLVVFLAECVTRKHGKGAQGETDIVVPITQSELAQVLAVSQFYLSRLLGDLASEGVVYHKKGRLYVNLPALNEARSSTVSTPRRARSAVAPSRGER